MSEANDPQEEFSEENTEGEQEQKPDTQSDGKKKGKEQSDLDKLRSVKDKEIADLTKQISELREQFTQAQQPQRVAELIGDINEIEDDTVRNKLLGMARTIVDYEQKYTRANQATKDFASTAMALEVASEYEGDWKEYKAKLQKATTQTEMESIKREIILDLKEEKASKQNRQERSKVDEGEGRAGPDERAKFRAELAKIDVTTPEGQKEFADKEREFQQRLRQLNRTR